MIDPLAYFKKFVADFLAGICTQRELDGEPSGFWYVTEFEHRHLHMVTYGWELTAEEMQRIVQFGLSMGA